MTELASPEDLPYGLAEAVERLGTTDPFVSRLTEARVSAVYAVYAAENEELPLDALYTVIQSGRREVIDPERLTATMVAEGTLTLSEDGAKAGLGAGKIREIERTLESNPTIIKLKSKGLAATLPIDHEPAYVPGEHPPITEADILTEFERMQLDPVFAEAHLPVNANGRTEWRKLRAIAVAAFAGAAGYLAVRRYLRYRREHHER